MTFWHFLTGGLLSGKYSRQHDVSSDSSSRVAWAEKIGWSQTNFSRWNNDFTWNVIDKVPSNTTNFDPTFLVLIDICRSKKLRRKSTRAWHKCHFAGCCTNQPCHQWSLVPRPCNNLKRTLKLVCSLWLTHKSLLWTRPLLVPWSILTTWRRSSRSFLATTNWLFFSFSNKTCS